MDGEKASRGRVKMTRAYGDGPEGNGSRRKPELVAVGDERGMELRERRLDEDNKGKTRNND